MKRILLFFLGLFTSIFFCGGFWLVYGQEIYEYNLLIEQGKETTAVVLKRYTTVRKSAKGRRREMNNTTLYFDGHTATINRNIEDNNTYVIYQLEDPSVFLVGEKKEGFFTLFHRNVGIYSLLLGSIIYLFLIFSGLLITYSAIVYKQD